MPNIEKIEDDIQKSETDALLEKNNEVVEEVKNAIEKASTEELKKQKEIAEKSLKFQEAMRLAMSDEAKTLKESKDIFIKIKTDAEIQQDQIIEGLKKIADEEKTYAVASLKIESEIAKNQKELKEATISEIRENQEYRKKANIFFKEGREQFKTMLKSKAKSVGFNLLGKGLSKIGMKKTGEIFKKEADVLKRERDATRLQTDTMINQKDAIDKEHAYADAVKNFSEILKNKEEKEKSEKISSEGQEKIKEVLNDKVKLDKKKLKFKVPKNKKVTLKRRDTAVPDKQADAQARLEKEKKKKESKAKKLMQKQQARAEKAQATANRQAKQMELIKKGINSGIKISKDIVEGISGVVDVINLFMTPMALAIAGILAATVVVGAWFGKKINDVAKENDKARKSTEDLSKKQAERRRVLKSSRDIDIDYLNDNGGYNVKDARDLADQVNSGKIDLNDKRMSKEDKEVIIDILKSQKKMDEDLAVQAAEDADKKGGDYDKEKARRLKMLGTSDVYKALDKAKAMKVDENIEEFEDRQVLQTQDKLTEQHANDEAIAEKIKKDKEYEEMSSNAKLKLDASFKNDEIERDMSDPTEGLDDMAEYDKNADEEDYSENMDYSTKIKPDNNINNTDNKADSREETNKLLKQLVDKKAVHVQTVIPKSTEPSITTKLRA